MYRSQAEEAQAAWLLSASRSVDSNERRFQCLRPLACRQRKKYDWLVGVLVFPFFIFGFRCSLRLGASQTDSRCGKAYTTSLNSRLKNWKRIKCSYLCVGVEDFFLRRAREDLFRLTLRRVMVDPMRKSLFSYSPYSISSYSACSRYIYSLMRCSFSAYRRYIYFVRRCSFSACWRYIYFVRRCSFSACRRYIYSVRRCSYSSAGGVYIPSGGVRTLPAGGIYIPSGVVRSPSTGGIYIPSGVVRSPSAGGIYIPSGVVRTPPASGLYIPLGGVRTPPAGGVYIPSGGVRTSPAGGINISLGVVLTPTVYIFRQALFVPFPNAVYSIYTVRRCSYSSCRRYIYYVR